MSDQMTAQRLAAELKRAYESGGPKAANKTLHLAEGRYGRDFAMAALNLWQERNKAENAFFEMMKKVFKGLPPNIALNDAMRIKATRGDELAKKLLMQLSSLELRFIDALFEAGVNVHPGWRRVGNGEYVKSSGAPEKPELIEWFYKNYPKEARRLAAEQVGGGTA